jgi:hypothetical protein
MLFNLDKLLSNFFISLIIYRMSNTRFNYDVCRTEKILQEATGPGKYMLNTPGPGVGIPFIADPNIRLQGWGANVFNVQNGHPVDIDSYLSGLGRHNNKDCLINESENTNFKPKMNSMKFPEFNCSITDETRATHPAWQIKDLEQKRQDYLFENPQNHSLTPFVNNLNTRFLEKLSYENKN